MENFLIMLLIVIISILQFTTTVSEMCNPQDKATLLQIKKELGHPAKLSSWDPTTDCCGKWVGVAACDNHTHRVTDLLLNQLDLYKPLYIPPSIFNLTSLSSIILASTPNLIGAIPPSITNLTNLTSLQIFKTGVSGEIPHTLWKIQTLSTIVFEQNKLTGPLPPSLSSLPNLFFLSLDYNQLTGTIPNSYGFFSKSLQMLSLSNNRLSGKIPPSLQKLKVKYVNLGQNSLEGDASMLFGSKKSTEVIFLGDNFLTFDFEKLGLGTNLQSVDLRNNRVYGKLPAGLTKLKLTALNVSNNNLCGQIPQGGKLQSFNESCYAHNKCLCGSPLTACRA
ncbi:polygalacturonase inhibitor 2-like [Vicia villosa]|uniref:polygalacturonase inhibitor 2-like n=1 Tax=Vicia villosa TaxID=3911 RepID=UPI00273C1939|nr:polygalacturonase inhibitor 2-like [Vicia villosa]